MIADHLFQDYYYNFIICLGLTITLEVIHGEERILNIILVA